MRVTSRFVIPVEDHSRGAFISFVSLTHHQKRLAMNITLHLIPIVSLIAGIVILIMPRLLSTIVAVYLIVVGLVGLFGSGNFLR